jgi:molybdate transport system regulatory protein
VLPRRLCTAGAILAAIAEQWSRAETARPRANALRLREGLPERATDGHRRLIRPLLHRARPAPAAQCPAPVTVRRRLSGHGGQRAKGAYAQTSRLPRPVSFPDPAVMDSPTDRPHLHLRIVFGQGDRLGPGKAELLERIARTGSIAAAGHEMGMSYKRAWELVGRLNAMFREPIVASTRGGPGGGGAFLTETGRQVLTLYRGVERDVAAAGATRLDALLALRGDIPDGK